MLKYATFWINALLRKSGVSNDLGPGTILDGIEPDFNLHYKIPLGTYCQVHEGDVPMNTNAPRTIGAIYLGPSGNLQGGYEFLSISTGRIVNRRAFTELPMPTEVVDFINRMAEDEHHNSHSRDVTLQDLSYVYLDDTDTTRNHDNSPSDDNDIHDEPSPDLVDRCHDVDTHDDSLPDLIDRFLADYDTDDDDDDDEFIQPLILVLYRTRHFPPIPLLHL